jgi:hypothetical protein
MKRTFLGAAGAVALAWAGSAAALITGTANIGETNADSNGGTIQFLVVQPNPYPGPTYTGPITGAFSHTFNFSTDPGFTDTFEDTFTFRVPVDGTGNGSFSASGTDILQSLTFSGISGEVTFSNGTDTVNVSILSNGKLGILDSDVDIFANALNTLTIRGTAHGNAFYNGSASFAPTAVPEASTWAMMLIGFGGIGGAIRYRRRKAVPVTASYKLAYS